ncbi:GNAT family N-acetyltransferase [Shouchella clausii]|uniref:GNAT family N-acetyltransferase n=1 Tax=Shouchella clausii TaxID=79880 RepID=UPI002148FC1F|nr:GNAT family N-acetyltransferase [Shouchella clausii]MCR1287098.1 GNAT family N-acetyltransferase [Shouchella clausii]
MNMLIRESVQHDGPSVCKLMMEQGSPDDQHRLEHRFKRYSNDSHHYIAVAEEQDELIGYVWAQDFGVHLRTGTKLCRLQELYVLPEHRSKGAGRQLFKGVLRWSHIRHATWLQWHASFSATAFYEKLGYEPVHQEGQGFPCYEIDFSTKQRPHSRHA